MIACETLDDHACKLDLAVEEDAVVRNEYMLKDNQNFMSAVNLVADVDVVVLFQLAGVTGLTAVNQGDALGIGRNCEGNRVVLVALAHCDGRHDQNLVGVYETGLMCLGAGYINAVRRALNNVNEQVRISLLGRSQAAVALDVGHCAVNCKVFVLYTGQELDEILVILGAACLVDLIGGGIDGVHCVHADTSLEAGCGLLAEHTLHLNLLDEVVGGLMHMGETVDLLAGQVGGSNHQILVLRILSSLVRSGKGVQGRADNRIVYRILDLLTEHPQVEVELAKGLNVLFFGHHSDQNPFSWSSLSCEVNAASTADDTRCVLQANGIRILCYPAIRSTLCIRARTAPWSTAEHKSW